MPALPADFLEVRLDVRRRARTTRATSRSRSSARRGPDAGCRAPCRAGSADADPRHRDRDASGRLRHRRPRRRDRALRVVRAIGVTPRRSSPAIEFVMRQARIGLDEIGAVAVDVGPGLYTGLRVGVAAAKAIASALRVPMVGIPSLDLLALPVRHTNRTIVAMIDARRGELFYAFYRAVPGGVQRLTPSSGRQARRRGVRARGDGAATSSWSATARSAMRRRSRTCAASSSSSSGSPIRRRRPSCSSRTRTLYGRSS